MFLDSTLDSAAPCSFLEEHITPEPSALDLLDEARLLTKVLEASLDADDMPRSYQCTVIIARINAAMARMSQQVETA